MLKLLKNITKIFQKNFILDFLRKVKNNLHKFAKNLKKSLKKI